MELLIANTSIVLISYVTVYRILQYKIRTSRSSRR